MQISPRALCTADGDPSNLPSLEHSLQKRPAVWMVRISKQRSAFEPDRFPELGKKSRFRSWSTHLFRLADIEAAYDLFSHQRDGVMKVAIRP